MIVANAAVAGSFSSLRQQIRPQDFAGARRQDERRGKPDDRRPERHPEARLAERLQQVLPALGAHEVRRRREDER